MAIQQGVTRLKNTRIVYLLDLFEGTVEKGQRDLVCGGPLDDWANPGLC